MKFLEIEIEVNTDNDPEAEISKVIVHQPIADDAAEAFAKIIEVIDRTDIQAGDGEADAGFEVRKTIAKIFGYKIEVKASAVISMRIVSDEEIAANHGPDHLLAHA